MIAKMCKFIVFFSSAGCVLSMHYNQAEQKWEQLLAEFNDKVGQLAVLDNQLQKKEVDARQVYLQMSNLGGDFDSKVKKLSKTTPPVSDQQKKFLEAWQSINNIPASIGFADRVPMVVQKLRENL